MFDAVVDAAGGVKAGVEADAVGFERGRSLPGREVVDRREEVVCPGQVVEVERSFDCLAEAPLPARSISPAATDRSFAARAAAWSK
jgi:hypothetical protein